MKFGKFIVGLVIASNIAFTIAVLYIFLLTGAEPVALIAAWFAFTTGELFFLADMGIITGDNIYYLTGGANLNGYVFSFSVRGGAEAFKSYVLDSEGYVGSDGKPIKEDTEFKMKSRRIVRDINVTLANGKTAKKSVNEKQVVFWAKKYADKARAERGELIKKALALEADPKKYSKATSYGAAKYLKNLEVDTETGEVLLAKKRPQFDADKVAEEEKYAKIFFTSPKRSLFFAKSMPKASPMASESSVR